MRDEVSHVRVPEDFRLVQDAYVDSTAKLLVLLLPTTSMGLLPSRRDY